MRIACVSVYDIRRITGEFSIRGYYQVKSLKDQLVDIEYIGPFKNPFYLSLCKAKRSYYELLNQVYSPYRDRTFLRYCAREISKKLSKLNVDLIFSPVSPGSQPVAYLECDQPIVIWTDATLKGYIDLFGDVNPHFSRLCKESIRDGIANERSALSRCSLAIYSSEWAAQTAIKNYKIPPSKVKVVPFGPYLEYDNTLNDVKNMVYSRSSNRCKLLFIGADWRMKGGDIAFNVAKKLNRMGLKTELTVVGCRPTLDEPIPSFVRSEGYISKFTKEGLNRIKRLFSESHFLILPSKSEAFGVVFCEASSFGVPSLATNVGGIPTAIRDGLNGKLFSKDASVEEYCQYILSLFSNYSEYKRLALSSFHEYQHRLNWSVAGQTVKKLMIELIG
jgi:glycosyltransferase involved in cell wall biosynthesis